MWERERVRDLANQQALLREARLAAGSSPDAARLSYFQNLAPRTECMSLLQQD